MDPLAAAPGTFCPAKVTLAAGTTTTLVNTGTTPFCIKGKAYSKAAMSNAASPTTDARTGSAFTGIMANQGTVVIVGFDKDGNVKACQGSVESLDSSGNFILAPQLPIVPDTVCPVGYIILKGGAALVGTFTFGSSNLSGVTGMTYTFGDLMTMPPRPIVS